MYWIRIRKLLIVCIGVILLQERGFAAIGDLFDESIRWTKHNLSTTWPGGSVSDPRTVSSESDEICIFCHTPHAAEGDGPIWNRNFSTQPYTPYTSSSLDFSSPSTVQPRGYSKLCLSCHDGSIAMGNIRNAPGAGKGSEINMFGAYGSGSLGPEDSMPVGEGAKTGYTRRLGVDLTNDHPISFKFTNTVVNADKELILPDNPIPGGVPWSTYLGVKRYPYQFGNVNKNAVQCTSCHNPHTTYGKFLRAPIYQEGSSPPVKDVPAYSQSNPVNNIICLSCHKVEPKQWINSTHAQDFAELKDFSNSGSADRVIRPGAKGKRVWQLACLACHDTHTVQGAQRILRNGATGADGTSAIENTCFMCHTDPQEKIPGDSGNISGQSNYPLTGGSTGTQAPDIKSQFDKAQSGGPGSAMPLTENISTGTTNAPYSKVSTNGVHEPEFILNKSPSTGKGEETLHNPPTSSAIHVECVDCHNPHQVIPGNRMKGMFAIRLDGQEIGGDTGTQPLQPVPGEKRGYNDDRSMPGETDVEPLVYEVCFRCHGDTFDKNLPYVACGAQMSDGTRANCSNPNGSATADSSHSHWRHRGHFESTPTFGVKQRGYSNKRKEFDPSTPGNSRRTGGNLNVGYVNNNPSYHPVGAPGRNGTSQLCKQLQAAFNLNCSNPASELGNLTIMCTDCHNNDDFGSYGLSSETNGRYKTRGPITGRNVGFEWYKRGSDKDSKLSTSAQDDPSTPQGPHGSRNFRILRGNYTTDINIAPGNGHRFEKSFKSYNFALCFLCHDMTAFTTGDKNWTNFFGDISRNSAPGSKVGNREWNTNLHAYHLQVTGARCHECHNNVHSNAEAYNTIYGDGTGCYAGSGCVRGLPADGHDGFSDGVADTHLINFGPQAGGTVSAYPQWVWQTQGSGDYSGSNNHHCYLRCHSVAMNCDYMAQQDPGRCTSG